MNKYVYGLDYQTNEPIGVGIINGVIEIVERVTSPGSETDLYVAPGLVDLQLNGYSGVDFNSSDLTCEDIRRVTEKVCRDGVTTYFPTVITNSGETTEKLLKIIAGSCGTDPFIDKFIGGIHLEGPFISPEDGPRGAHPGDFVQAPDWDLFCRFQEAANVLIRMITLSPEWPQTVGFIEKCVKTGVKVGIGHTAASNEQIRQAVDAGATISTHLGNGCHALLPRHHNYLWEQLASDQLWLSCIGDSFHLPAAILKVFLKVKPDKSVLISDATSFAGMNPGIYSGHIGGKVQLLENGRLATAEDQNVLAGAALPLKAGVAHLFRENIASLGEAWDLASVQPLTFLNGIREEGLQEGRCADMVLFRIQKHDIEIVETIKDGVSVYRKNN